MRWSVEQFRDRVEHFVVVVNLEAFSATVYSTLQDVRSVTAKKISDFRHGFHWPNTTQAKIKDGTCFLAQTGTLMRMRKLHAFVGVLWPLDAHLLDAKRINRLKLLNFFRWKVLPVLYGDILDLKQEKASFLSKTNANEMNWRASCVRRS